MKELLTKNDAPIPWLVENLLIMGGCSILVSKPKTGKTTFTRSLGMKVAAGLPFLGQPTVSAQVLIITMEDKASEIARHFRSMGAIGSEDIQFLVGIAPSVQQLRDTIIKDSIGLVVIDTLILGIKGLVDINDYALTSRALSPYVQISRELNCHIMFTHHFGKIERGGGDQILGSTALFASVDAVLILDRNKNTRTFRTIMRYGKDWDQLAIIMKDDGCLEIDGTRQEQHPSIEVEMLRFLSSQNEATTEKIIDAEVFGRTSEKRRILREMVINGKVIRSGKGSRSEPFQYSTPHIKEQTSGTS